jgi:hypothetical protein
MSGRQAVMFQSAFASSKAPGTTILRCIAHILRARMQTDGNEQCNKSQFEVETFGGAWPEDCIIAA